MAGGRDNPRLNSVEMINLETMSSCVVDVTLKWPSHAHTGHGNLVCGGSGDGGNHQYCYNVATKTSIDLINARGFLTSWSTNDGIYLMGGYPSGTTTELMTGDTSQAGFTLKYTTR